MRQHSSRNAFILPPPPPSGPGTCEGGAAECKQSSVIEQLSIRRRQKHFAHICPQNGSSSQDFILFFSPACQLMSCSNNRFIRQFWQPVIYCEEANFTRMKSMVLNVLCSKKQKRCVRPAGTQRAGRGRPVGDKKR